MSFLLNKKAVKNIFGCANMYLICGLIGIILFIFIDNFKYKLVEGIAENSSEKNGNELNTNNSKNEKSKFGKNTNKQITNYNPQKSKNSKKSANTATTLLGRNKKGILEFSK